MSKPEPISSIQKRLKTNIESSQQEINLLKKIPEEIDLTRDKMVEIKKLETMRASYFHKLRYSAEECAAEHNIKILDYDIQEREDRRRRINFLEEKIKKDKRELDEYSQVLEGFPRNLNSSVVADSLAFFEGLTFPISPEFPYINILMIGETGSGKSTFLNTFATALTDSKLVKDTYKAAPKETGESVTRKINLEPLYFRGKQLPIRFYDIPGICEENSVRQNELDMMLNGELKPGLEMARASEMKKMTDFIRKDPTPANEIHCVLYIIRATSNLSTKLSKSFEQIKKVRDSRKGEDDIRQFVIVTAIDEIGVPNEYMEYAYQYPCVRNIRDRVVNALKILPSQVIPVSNYYVEGVANNVKNAMSLNTLWRVCSSGKDYIERRSKREILQDFYT